jgi:hypothetical protein
MLVPNVTNSGGIPGLEETCGLARRGDMNSALNYESARAYEAELIRLADRQRVASTPRRPRRTRELGRRLVTAIRVRARVAAPRAATSKG